MKNKLTKLFLEFFESEQSSGICLIICTIASIIITNSYFGRGFSDFWHTKIGFDLGGIALKYSAGSALLSLVFWLSNWACLNCQAICLGSISSALAFSGVSVSPCPSSLRSWPLPNLK